MFTSASSDAACDVQLGKLSHSTANYPRTFISDSPRNFAGSNQGLAVFTSASSDAGRPVSTLKHVSAGLP